MKAIKLIGRAAERKPLSSTDFTCVRDFLVVTALYENGSRPGPLQYAKLRRFEQATFTENPSKWTILVDEHKTSCHQGPADITMDQRLYGYLKIYVQFIRPKFAAAGEENLFVKDDGLAFNPSTIGRRVTEFFKKAGVRGDVNITATNIRKLFSDQAFDMSPKKKRLINQHMKHKESTADINYVLKHNAMHSAISHEIMRDIIQGSQQEKEPVKEDEESDQEKEPEAAGSLTIDAEAHRSKSNESVERGDSEEGGETAEVGKSVERGKSVEGGESPDCASVSSLSSLSSLSVDDKVVISSVFNDDINAGRLLTANEVRAKMKCDHHLRTMVPSKDKVKKIIDLVRYLTNCVRQTRLDEELAYDEFDVNTLSTFSSGFRHQWDINDSTVIENRFVATTKMPKRQDILMS
ncbi:hypothetical protein OS493_000410 [Desmophyllum pertusum]|uniref:Uncharacterized protein n=1 Tax=Desmophyllum pertusum TaxID=174260 RepID=A0A9X0A757_9CNID|nr:hypothetical protein OS493_000410 [Desmophyllum pertusum]